MYTTYAKKIFFTFLITVFSSVTAMAASYCEGYTRGYKEGYAEAVEIPGIDPVVPICTPRPIKIYDNPDHEYQVGYKKGHADGYNKGEEKEKQQP